MFLRRFFDERLAQASYLVGCEHARSALIVDPNRNTSQYLEVARRERFRITHVTETHIHADFVSGARQLAEVTGAQLCLSGAGGPDWQYGFAANSGAQILTDGSAFMIGDVLVEAVHTPGHTPEHMCFLLSDTSRANEPAGVLTGDFVFVGDVGRPDLLERVAGVKSSMENSARQLFRSLQSFKEFPDYLQVWPGHGAGSACGKALGEMPQSTVGYEKRFNWGLIENDEQRFVTEVLTGQPEPPSYFAIMKRLNRDGPPVSASVTPAKLSAQLVASAIKNGESVIDTRLEQSFSAMHARGSVNIPRNRAFLNWAGALLPYDRPAVFIAAGDSESRKNLAQDLSLIGFDAIDGVFPQEEMESLIDEVGGDTVEDITPNSVLQNGGTFLDVRGRSEYDAGHIAGALNIPLGELQSRLAEVPPGLVIVHCQGGSRSVVAASILKRDGRSELRNLAGGFEGWERSGHPVERGARKTGA